MNGKYWFIEVIYAVIHAHFPSSLDIFMNHEYCIQSQCLAVCFVRNCHYRHEIESSVRMVLSRRLPRFTSNVLESMVVIVMEKLPIEVEFWLVLLLEI